MKILACLNGETMPAEEARVPILDRGFLFGDAVYEVLRVYQGRCWLEDEHLTRLRRSLEEVEFLSYDIDRLVERMHRTIDESQIQEATVYLHITRGVTLTRHVFPDPPVPPTELIVVRPFDDGPTAKLRDVGARAISHPDLRWKRCDVKTTNLLGNVLAIEHARRAGCIEAILVDDSGFVTEATHTSVLWIRDGRLEGTPEGPEILPGVTRRLAIRLAETIGIPFIGSRVTVKTLIAADEVILVGTTSEVMSVVEIDGQTVGSGAPGPLSRRLSELYRQEVQRRLAGPLQSK
jgi:D-alanine transaminase